MISAARLKSIGLALLIGSALLSAPSTRAAALQFECIEPSRYKNLLQIFHDDPSTLFSYFNIARRPLPSPETCRALLVTGTIARQVLIGLDSVECIGFGAGWLLPLARRPELRTGAAFRGRIRVSRHLNDAVARATDRRV